ncbi:hypothetical protein AB0C24_11830 [Amycolatopsis japonica]|uniref:hypothetical protein n=1 Tax=Amycolatopsis japonica TaxID=208439 RepID=UPI0033E9AC63
MTITYSAEGELERRPDAVLRLPAKIRAAIKAGHADEAVRMLIAGGKRDENWLIDVVFHTRHPELDGRRIRPGEQVLAKEWSAIRTSIVRPMLLAAPGPPVPTAPAPAVAATPVRSVAQWRQRALLSAGIDPARWNPDAGFAVTEPIVKLVYAYYTKLFNSNESLLWAGLAKLAGAQVYRRLAMTQASIDATAMTADQITTADLIIFYSQTVQVQLLVAQRAIFEDLAWQHEAFVVAGPQALEATGAARIPIGAWRDIASGDPGRVRSGNRALALREQRDVLAPFYESIRDINDFDEIPQRMSAEAPPPLPGAKPFREAVPGGDITVFEDRWKWIETDILPVYQALTPGRRRQLVNTPLADLAAQRWPAG